jgi:pectin methylesterase-like acyl-CoA thioesterase
MNKIKTRIGNQFAFPKIRLVVSVGIALGALLVWPTSTPGALTLNLDINTGSSPNYSGTAIAPDSGNYWNSFVTPAASSLTLTSVRDSANNLITSTITIARNGGANFSSFDNSGGGGNPNPAGLMRDYLYGATHTITVSNLPAGLYHLFAYAHGDNTGQASTVTVNAANGGGSGTTSDVGEYRNIYQAGAQGSAYVKLPGTVGAAGTFVFTAGNYVNGFQLQQLSAPGISGLTNQTVIAGTTAVLNPTSTGTPPPTYQWRSNSVTLASATNASLVLNNVQYTQNGTVYSLVATNPAGAATNSMTLTVIVTPAITGLVNQAAPVGSDVTLTATVSGVPTPALQWRKNGTNLVGATSASYFIANAQATDSGTYSLVASNAAGVVTNTATLTVSAGNVAPSIVGPTDQTVVQNTNATFATSVSGLPLPTLQWRLNGVDLLGQTNSSLTVSNVQYSQNGHVYSVLASNVAGLATNSATLFVLVPAAISQQPTNLSVIVGSPATFSVGASGVPAVKYQWSKNGSPLANATNASYLIANAQGADNGAVFSVVVSNSVGNVTGSDAVLTVLSAMTGAFLPTNNATGIAPDQQLRIVFPSAIKLGSSGVIKIRDAANDSVVATIDRSQFLSYVPGNTSIQAIPNAAIRSVQGASYYYMPITIYGKEAWITFTNRLAYNKTYYVNMDPGLLLDTNNAAIMGVSGSTTWRFSTKASGPATPTASTGLTNITVGLDGVGDFATCQGAFDWIPQNNTLARTIRVKPGIYRDNATLAQNRNFVTIVGEGASRTNAQIVYPFAFFAPPNTVFTAGSLRIESSDVTVLNLTLDNIIYNEYHPTGESSSGAPGAFAGAINTLATKGRRIVFENMLIKGGQDTIYHDSSTGVVYFHDCEVWGSVDYIYGNSLAVYDQCDIVQIRSTGGPITAPNTAAAQPYGLVFLNCTFPRALIANGYPSDVGTANTTFMRPWRQDGMTAIINCTVGSQVSTKGWLEWGNRHTTCRARESGTTLIGGGSVTPAQRQSAGGYWLNTIDSDYVSNPSIDPDVDPSLLLPPGGTNNRVAVTINPNDYTLSAIFGNSYYNLGGWLPTVMPTITAQPTNRTVSAGAPVSFSVVAVGLPDPTYQWRKNGTNLVGQTNATLTLASAKLADNATYSVIISNSAGVVTSSSAVLTVPAVSAPLTPTFSNGALNLSWPANQTGFRLEAQTNSLAVGLNNNWFTIVGSSATNQMSLPINPAHGNVFLRLTYP